MSTPQQLAVDRALTLLRAASAKYKIILPDGTEYGTLEVKPKKPERKRRATKHPFGEQRAYLAKYLPGLLAGESVKVPVDKYDIEALQSGISAYGVKTWGNGNAITARDKDGQYVEVLRVD